MSSNKQNRQKFLTIFGVVAAYWTISMSIVFMNKWLLSGTHKLRTPFFVTWFQCIFALILTYILSWIPSTRALLGISPHMRINKRELTAVMPLSIVFVGMLAFNNLMLQQVPVTFYYIGRSLSTVFNLLLTYYVLHRATSWRAVLACCVIVLGFLLGCVEEDHTEKEEGAVSWLGIVLGVLGSLFTCLNAIYTSRVLPLIGNDIWKLTLCNSVNAIFLLLPCVVLFGEHLQLIAFFRKSSADGQFSDFWLILTASAIFGWLMGLVTGLQIQVTSALTHNISGTAKAAAQTVIAVWWTMQFSSKSVLWWFSNTIVLVGSYAYVHVRLMEMVEEKVK